MTRLLAAALLALTASTALAGQNYCVGTIVVGPEWTAVEESTPTQPIPMNCRFKTASELGKRILRLCPNGSECELRLSFDEKHPKDYQWDGKTLTIIKWPKYGVDKN